eukprot:scaffold803_cov310-Pinguiococcus_pyrenoidosus.AAC.139
MHSCMRVCLFPADVRFELKRARKMIQMMSSCVPHSSLSNALLNNHRTCPQDAEMTRVVGLLENIKAKMDGLFSSSSTLAYL